MSQDLTPNPSTCSLLVIFMYWARETQGSIFLVLRSRSFSSAYAKLHTLAANNNRSHLTRSIYYCLFASCIFVYCSLCTSRLWWITHFQRNTNWEFASTYLPVCNEPHNIGHHFLPYRVPFHGMFGTIS